MSILNFTYSQKVLCGFPQQKVEYDDSTAVSVVCQNNSTISVVLGGYTTKSIKAGKEKKKTPRKPRSERTFESEDIGDEDYDPSQESRFVIFATSSSLEGNRKEATDLRKNQEQSDPGLLLVALPNPNPKRRRFLPLKFLLKVSPSIAGFILFR